LLSNSNFMWISFEVNDKKNQSPLVNMIQVNLEKQIVE